MVCSWQFPLVNGLLQMTVEEEECEGRKRRGVFLLHAFPLSPEETTALPVLMCLDLSPQLIGRCSVVNFMMWWKWECKLLHLRVFIFLFNCSFHEGIIFFGYITFTVFWLL